MMKIGAFPESPVLDEMAECPGEEEERGSFRRGKEDTSGRCGKGI